MEQSAKIDKRTWKSEDKWKPSDYSIIKIGKNTEKSPEQLKETCFDSDYSEKSSDNSGKIIIIMIVEMKPSIK